ncbi:hypothetical protein [Acetobacterium wieringae]|jgi:predicted DNA-binding protein|uniref:TraY domain-containing protein n=1 Tax=Acetobacterium wieringae TaxID=52694 RepID=A0A1F2PJM1_9FIRM|nr:hypothetical protein [Acetobacterium wieringae]OFV71533.1 hypothetical protein ACWI_10330 [Acetobacterium wieringae]
MTTNKKAFTMRMRYENFQKIKYISEQNKRSIAMQIEFLIEQCISDYEKNTGIINLAKELNFKDDNID